MTKSVKSAKMVKKEAKSRNNNGGTTMYTKDKSNRITLRLNDEQFEFVKCNADILGVSPSEFLRMVVNSSMALAKAAEEKLKKVEEARGRENDKADIDDKL